MAVWDVFCCISGAMHFKHCRGFLDPLKRDLEGEIPYEILRALMYTVEDVPASQDRIILGYRRSEDLSLGNPGAFPVGPDVWMIHDVVPLNYQVYTDAHSDRNYVLEDERVVTHYSLVIMRHRFQDFTPKTIYEVVGHNDPRAFIGPVARTHDQRVNWLAVADIEEGVSAEKWWFDFLTRGDRTRRQIIQDAWMGPGNMWIFVRPDQFPIRQALAYEPLQEMAAPDRLSDTATAPSLNTLPLDILEEISAHLPIISVLLLPQINKRIRALVIPHLDSIVRTSLERNDRYLLPETPSAAYRSHEEFTWWKEQCGYGGLSPDDRIPWTAYARACIQSPSMRNRKRIWDIVGEMEANARKLGLLD